MQCCGDAFEIGSVVEWKVAPVDTEFLTAVLGEDEAAGITDAEERHGDLRGAEAVGWRGSLGSGPTPALDFG
jgi:hypothetical protein